MKTQIKLFFGIFTMLVCQQVYSQSTISGVVGNVRVGGAYIGWDGTGTNPGTLEIRNNFNDDINIFTSGNQQMTIRANGFVGISTSTPTNRLEINALIPGNSGLTFSQLNSGSGSINSNASNTVLSVDNTGRVILVNDQTAPNGGVGQNILVPRWSGFVIPTIAFQPACRQAGIYNP